MVFANEFLLSPPPFSARCRGRRGSRWVFVERAKGNKRRDNGRHTGTRQTRFGG